LGLSRGREESWEGLSQDLSSELLLIRRKRRREDGGADIPVDLKVKREDGGAIVFTEPNVCIYPDGIFGAGI
jgi:hypothetical protein